jgi:pyruvate formate lyase activating enzyme
METEGLIFNIQRFSLHDGPGIRTTVFFKGCPLSCWWCQNPEGMSMEQVIFRHSDRCIGCGDCIEKCPETALELSADGPVIDRLKCNLCLICTDICPTGALETAGWLISVKELVGEVLKDRIVFEESGGGATISGGEPLMQPEFLAELLSALKQEGIHTAVETSGLASWKNLSSVIDYTDLFIYDLKLVDPELCRQYLGVNSDTIVTNLDQLHKSGAELIVRMPIIPTVNDSSACLQMAAESLKEIGITKLELLPYHRFGSAKYEKLGLEYKLDGVEPPDQGAMDKVKTLLEAAGISTTSEGQ